jgi:hypothetical protein
MLGGQKPVWMDAAVAEQPDVPVYFPYGGYITMGLSISRAGGKGVSSSSGTKFVGLTGAISGVWEVQADCQYVPE